MSYRWHLSSIDDLVTPYEAVRAGFVALALEKNRRATPFVAVPLVNKNVDLCLLSCSPTEIGSSVEAKKVYQSHELYIALGELKGGIDPAGADEHWKTAGSALERIRSAFRNIGLSPDIFFIGAAIEKEMAGEIWHSLETGALANSANLTNENHIASISRWLTSL